jgi:multisubunit Na+/H+ antiporter MnhF subunit
MLLVLLSIIVGAWRKVVKGRILPDRRVSLDMLVLELVVLDKV